MKTKTLFLLASLVVLTTIARAAQYPIDNDVMVLPTVTVEAPRYTPAEKQINASLAELRQQAKAPVAIPADFTTLKAVVTDASLIARQALDKKVVRLAKS